MRFLLRNRGLFGLGWLFLLLLLLLLKPLLQSRWNDHLDLWLGQQGGLGWINRSRRLNGSLLLLGYFAGGMWQCLRQTFLCGSVIIFESWFSCSNGAK